MGTGTMYQTIMDLPLFKGVGEEHISTFLEKTRIEFKKYAAGEKIVNEGEEVKKLKFLLKGKIRLEFTTRNGEVTVSSLYEGHDVIGATRLFGIHPYYDGTITAETETSVMEFSKEKYLSLLGSDPIYILNFANLLSLYAQRIPETLRRFRRLGPERVIAEWVVLFTTQRNFGIRINGLESLEKSYGSEAVNIAIASLEEKGLARQDGKMLEIPDREALIEYVSDFEYKE
ncbi:MAG: cyclic nucleotide-binding domain-containing protein [Muribaculaceae bacterium]|nr:cyclic nucleotide-binding domain-containing protein [Muribaculaceae bacterium]